MPLDRNNRRALDDDVWRYLPLGPLPTVVVGLVGLGLLLTVGVRVGARRRRLAVVLLVLTTFAILAVTLGRGGGTGVSLHPGDGIRLQLAHVNRVLGMVNIAGNILMFVPLG